MPVTLTSHVIRRAYLLILLVAVAAGLTPAAAVEEVRDSVEVHFRQGKSDLDTAFSHNGRHIDSLVIRLDDQAPRVKSVAVTGAASPEGSVALNRSLSRARATRIFDYSTTAYRFPTR